MKWWRNIMKRKREIFSVLYPGCVIAILDTETIGVKDDDKIIQFSAVKYRVDKHLRFHEEDSLDLYINPGCALPEKIVEITGITDEVLNTAPTEDKVVAEIFSFLTSADVFAAYNAEFDLKKLRAMSYRTSVWFNEHPTLDVLEMSRDLIPYEKTDSYKLGVIAEQMLPDDTFQFHSSIEDVRATGKIMEIFVQQYWKYHPEEKEYIPVRLEEAHLFINPAQQSMQRIKIKLDEGDEGSIFYDILRRRWSCKVDSKSVKLFNSIDLEKLEDAFLAKYATPWKLKTMDEVAKSWMHYRSAKRKEAKSKTA